MRVFLSFITAIAGCVLIIAMTPAAPGEVEANGAAAVWFDPAWSDTTRPSQPGSIERATVWFEPQLIGEGEAYVRRTAQLADARRRELRRIVIDSLQALSRSSWERAKPAIDRLTTDGYVVSCRRHWIVNALTCELPGGRPDRLAEVPGAHRVFRAFARPSSPAAPPKPSFVPEASSAPAEYAPDAAKAPWNAAMLGVEKVWRDEHLSGRGVLHVIHDFGWTFAPPQIRSTLWRNMGEIPGNGVDDEGNGLIDDVHGFDFDRNTPALESSAPGLPGGVTHGDLTAAVATGRELGDTAVIVGIAPGSRWAAVISILDIARGVEWALEHGADTYSMSFSLAGLGELRAHWRRVMDHAALAGLYMISGAGNFANPDAPTYVPVPMQMRTPEDIPFSVFGVAGVGRVGKRPVFSSQGPVLWRTEAYGDGEVLKPDLATINTNLLIVDSAGNASYRGAPGWSGNSFAGPHLAGVIALMLEADPDLTPWVARDILVRTAKDLEPAGPDPQTGAGLVDAWAAVRAVRDRARAPAPRR
jgi:hypothetical protein